MHKCGPLLCRAQGYCPYCYVRNRTKLGLKRATTFSFHSPTFELPKIDKRYGINPTNRFGPGSPSPVATCHTKRVAIDSTIGYSCTFPFPPSFSSPKSRFSFVSDSPPSHKNYPSLSFPLSEDIAEKKSMAEATSALCFSTFSTSIPFSKELISSPSTSFIPRRLSSPFQRRRSRSGEFALKASGSSHFLGDDAFGFYPWENPDSAESRISPNFPCYFVNGLIWSTSCCW